MPDWAPMGMKMSHGMKTLSKISIACMRDCIDMREAHFHNKNLKKQDAAVQPHPPFKSFGSSLFSVVHALGSGIQQIFRSPLCALRLCGSISR
jgi:hypothetical protein